MMESGGDEWAEDFEAMTSTNGAQVRLSCSSGFGSNNQLIFTGAYVDLFQTTQQSLKSGILKLDNTALTQIGSSVTPFKMTSNQSSILNLFGAQRQLKQYNYSNSTILNQANIRLPNPVAVNGVAPQATKSNNALSFSWAADPNNSDIFVIVYTYPNLGTNGGTNEDQGLTSAFYKIYKTADDGAFTVPAADLSTVPAGCRYLFLLVRASSETFADSRNSQRQNMILVTSSAMGTEFKG